VAGVGEEFASRWEPCAAQKFLVVSRAVAGGGEAQWLVDVAAGTVTADDGQDDDAEWSILGSPQTWQAILDG
jgi:hypothetical protein